MQVDNLSGGDTITVTGSATQGGTYYPLGQILNQNTGTTAASISASGRYTVLFGGNQWLKFTKVGGASTPVITVSGAQ